MKYKTIPENKISHGHKWELNKWYKTDGKIELCKNGFHCSNNFIDAMKYILPGYMVLVEVHGKYIKKKDKSVHKEMKIVKWKKWTKKDSIALAIFAAELVLPNYEKQFPGDNRPRKVIELAKKVLKYNNKKTQSVAEEARSVAESVIESMEQLSQSAAEAARSVARLAESVARSTEESAAKSVVWPATRSIESAARSAAWSAEAAARSSSYNKIIQQCHDFIIERKFK